MRNAYCFLNGKIVRFDNAALSLNDLAILRGYGVFDFLRTYTGKPFLLKEHLDRFEQSARRLHLTIPFPRKKIEASLRALIEKNKFPETHLRLVLTGGTSNTAFFLEGKSAFFIIAEKAELLPEKLYAQGASIHTHEYLRDIPDAKTNNYLVALRTRHLTKHRRSIEMLYTHKGNILEATTSNFFLVKGNTLITPKKNILIGTTRNFVIRLARKNFRVEERDVQVSELRRADEAFLTATNKEILPVVRVDAQKIGSGKVGPHTKKLMQLFKAKAKSL